jgi:hypothetical protein
LTHPAIWLVSVIQQFKRGSASKPYAWPLVRLVLR